MPIDVAVEQPNTRVIGNESDNKVTLGWCDKGITASRVFWEAAGGILGGIVREWVTVGVVIERRTI